MTDISSIPELTPGDKQCVLNGWYSGHGFGMPRPSDEESAFWWDMGRTLTMNFDLKDFYITETRTK